MGALFLFSHFGGVPVFSPSGPGGDSFSRALADYDARVRENPDMAARQRNGLLDSLEKKALDTENTLSVLKRRRALVLGAEADREPYFSAYAGAVGRARKAYPFSAQLGTLGAELIILNSRGQALSGEAAAEMQELAALMSQGALQDLALAFSVYSGAMGDPASARLLPRELFPLLCSFAQGEEREAYLVNYCIRILLEGELNEAEAMVNSLFDSGGAINSETYLFGGEFFYDHGNFYRTAELFSIFTSDRFLARQGDALWLGGFIEQARGLWKIAAASGEESGGAPAGAPAGGPPGGQDFTEDPLVIKARVLYNLASSAGDVQEEGRWLEQLFALDSPYPQGRIFAIIRYSRLVPPDRALTILSQTDQNEGLFALELLRRKSEDWTVDRTVAETWLLLNNHPQDERLFEWAAWYFNFQRRYDETALALRNAGINRVEGPWSGLHRAFAQLRERNLEEAEKTLRSIVRTPEKGRRQSVPGRRQQPLWQATANLGLVLDMKKDPREALQYYEIAMGQLSGGQSLTGPEKLDEELRTGQGIPAAGPSLERRDASRIQTRIAGILRVLGREQDSLRALDYALDLDPENLEASLEKRRLDSGRNLL
jgi:tetratricopeptide (TPR) repeat protein